MSNPPPSSSNAAAGPSRVPPKFAPRQPVRNGPSSASQPAASVTTAPVPIRTTSEATPSRMGIGAAMKGATPAPGADSKPRMVFKPSMPTRKIKSEAVDVKPLPSLLRAAGPNRGRGGASRGRGGGRGGAASGGGSFGGDEMIASGPFAMGPSQANRARRTGGAASYNDFAPSGPQINLQRDRKPVYTAQGEEYSDEETQNGRVEIIDMELVPEELGESAPTGLIRDRSISAKGKEDKKERVKGKRKEKNMEVKEGEEMTIVKSEPMDEVAPIALPNRRVERLDDTMLSEDEDVDVDMDGNRLTISDEATPEVAAIQAVDLSESEGEEEEEDMTGDFIKEGGMENPEDKLYLFQFPNPFPHFVPNPDFSLLRDVDTMRSPEQKPHGILKKSVQFDAGAKDEKKDAKRPLKENEEKRKAYKELEAKEKLRKPEGRIGTLVIMKSGKAKMVLGDGIVMDVTTGVPTTFIQQVVHLDDNKRRAAVLGEVHKTYVMLPDVDRLLDDLTLQGGVVPGETDVKKEEDGLMKME